MDYSRMYTFDDVTLPQLTYRFPNPTSIQYLPKHSPVNENKVTRKNNTTMTEYINMEEAEANTDHAENHIDV